MRYTLNSLILRTRFTRGFLALTVLLLLYSGLIGFFSPHSNDDVIYALTFTAFLFLVIGVSGGVAVRRPDRDFLFTMPLDRRKLGSSLLLAQFLTTGVSEAYFLFVIFRFLGHPIAIGLAVVALIGTAGMLTGVGIINYSLTLPRRVVVSAVMALLALSPLLGFRYSFTSPLVSYSPAGTAVSAALGSIFLAYSYRNITRTSFAEGGLRLSGREEFRSEMGFSGLTPRRAIVRRYMNLIDISSRSSAGGSIRVSQIRSSTKAIVLFSSAVAAVYAAVVLTLPSARISFGSDNFNIITFLFSGYVSVILPILFSQGAISNERLWAGPMTMDLASYFRYAMLSKMAQSYIIMAPFTVANVFLYFMGLHFALNSVPVFLGISPTAVIIYAFLTARYAPVQITDSEFMSQTYSGRQFLLVLPMLVLYLLAFVSVAFLTFGLAVSATMYCITAYILARRKLWRHLVNMLTERGFV
ncbi:hypothetical protein GCM10007108_00020 [Thermogymnomonas acidicola]|uniref:Uncharacterized protein n=1 Tax=Thermogymnomonas acidicola TaxID=399579 RepID=A0AA37BPD0_9ARCH|nr:hypothetical protein [Thermogymnomonas acidicola]GGM65731.1 hypothetical protein GCM10007108_00020 [Thermogymnomonas acidicola]